jgi:hypothetical protein
MKVEYSIEPISEVVVDSNLSTIKPIHHDSADILFQIGSDGILKEIKIIFSGLPIKWQRKDLINQDYPETQNKAYRICKYLTNRIQLQTAQKAFKFDSLKDTKCEVSPETPEEIENYKKFRKYVMNYCEINYSIQGSIDITDYETKFTHAQAYSNYIDAKNTDNPINKYVSFYKVIESFFNKTGPNLDKEVSNFKKRFDNKFTPERFEELRLLRNRCIHPHHRDGHISSDELLFMEELSKNTKELEIIAGLLLEKK